MRSKDNPLRTHRAKCCVWQSAKARKEVPPALSTPYASCGIGTDESACCSPLLLGDCSLSSQLTKSTDETRPLRSLTPGQAAGAILARMDNVVHRVSGAARQV